MPSPWLGMIKAEEYGLQGYTGQRERRHGPELVRLQMKGMLWDGSFTISKNWLALGGAVSPNPERGFFLKMTKWPNNTEPKIDMQ